MREEELRSLIENPGNNVIIVHGPVDTGKSFTVKNVLDKMNINYIYIDDYSMDNILGKFNLKNDFIRYLNIMKTVSPVTTNEKNVFYSLIMERIRNIKGEGRILVLDQASKIEKDMLEILVEFINNQIYKNKWKIIIIYNDESLSDSAKYIFDLIRGKGVKELIFQRPGFNELKNIIENMGYFIPDSVLGIIYSKTNGSIGETLNYIKILETRKFIQDGLFLKPPTEDLLREIKSVIFSGVSPVQDLKDIEKRVLLFISLAEEGIDAFDLPSLMQINEDDVINSIDELIRLKMVREEGNRVMITSNELSREILSQFSNIYINSARLKMAEYMKSRGRLGESGRLYFYSGKFEEAYTFLLEEGMKYFSSGDLSRALEFLEFCSKIKYDENVSKKILEILTLLGDYEKMLDFSERLIMEHPGKNYYKVKYAEALYQRGEFSKAEMILRDLLNSAKEDSDLLYDQIQLSRVLISREKYSEAWDLLEKALEISRKIKDLRNEAYILRLMGNIKFSMEEMDEALDLYKRSLSLIENTNFYEDIASLYNNIANILVDKDIIEGRDYYRKAMEIAQKYWYVDLLETVYHNLSIIEYYNGNIDYSLDMQGRAMRIAIASGRYDLALLSIMNMMDPIIKKGNIEDQVKYTDLAIELSSKIGDELMENFFRAYRKVLNTLMGKEDNIEAEIDILKKGTPMFKDSVYYANSAMEMWRGNVRRSNEIQKESIDKKMKRITPDLLIDMTDLIEFLLYENFFYGNRNDDIKNYLNIVKNDRNYPNMRYVQWRINIINAILDQNERMFLENLKNLERQGLRYLVAKLKIIYGLYDARKNGKRKILDEGLSLMKSLNVPGYMKGYSLAFSFGL
jgi:tetratricopeptide (TPR) repeat protein